MLFRFYFNLFLCLSFFPSIVIASSSEHSQEILSDAHQTRSVRPSYPRYPFKWDQQILIKKPFERLVAAQKTQDFGQKFALYASILEDESTIPALQARVAKDLGQIFIGNYPSFRVANVWSPDELHALADFTYVALTCVVSDLEAPLQDRVSALKSLFAFLNHSDSANITNEDPRYIYLADKDVKLRNFRSIVHASGLHHHQSVELNYLNYLKRLVQYYVGYWNSDLSYGNKGIEVCEEAQARKRLTPDYMGGFKYYELCLRHMMGREDFIRARSLAQDILKLSSQNEFTTFAKTYLTILDTRDLLNALESGDKRLGTKTRKTKNTKSKRQQNDPIKDIQQKIEMLRQESLNPSSKSITGLAHFEYARLSLQALEANIPFDKGRKKDIISSLAWFFNRGDLEAHAFVNSYMVLNILQEVYFVKKARSHPLLDSDELKQYFEHHYHSKRVISLLESYHYVSDVICLMLTDLKMTELMEEKRSDDALKIAIHAYEHAANSKEKWNTSKEYMLNILAFNLMAIRDPSLEQRLSLFKAAHQFSLCSLPPINDFFLKTILVGYASSLPKEILIETQHMVLAWIVDLYILSESLNLPDYVPHLLFGGPIHEADRVLESAPAPLYESVSRDSAEPMVSLESALQSVSLSAETIAAVDVPNQTTKDDLLSMVREPFTDFVAEGVPSSSSESDTSIDGKKTQPVVHLKARCDVFESPLVASVKKKKTPPCTRQKTDDGDRRAESSSAALDPKMQRYREAALSIIEDIKKGGRVQESQVFNTLNKLRYTFNSSIDEHFTWHPIHRSGRDKKGSSRNIKDPGRRQSLKEHLMRAVYGDPVVSSASSSDISSKSKRIIKKRSE
ncbi:MAG: hypothetical protein ACTHJ4_04575 [Candidatus Nucleicultricaceae bacterium]